MNISQNKEKLRKEISLTKKRYSSDDLYNRSEEVMSIVEITGIFQQAKTIFIYNNLSDEVQTGDFIHRWSNDKKFYLPVVVKDDIVFREYKPTTTFEQSPYGIMEPVGDNFPDYKKVDLIIVPGVAFDRNMNRLGRGKGYYDRFLSGISAPKMGICFEFQLFDTVPAETTDVKMDYIVSENEFIWK